MNYKIMSAQRVDSLVELVNVAMVDGWEPVGSPLFAQDLWHQALCRPPVRNELSRNTIEITRNRHPEGSPKW